MSTLLHKRKHDDDTLLSPVAKRPKFRPFSKDVKTDRKSDSTPSAASSSSSSSSSSTSSSSAAEQSNNFLPLSPPYTRHHEFGLDATFLKSFSNKPVSFGFTVQTDEKERKSGSISGLGDLVYRRTYSRVRETGEKEEFWETLRRVVEETFALQLDHMTHYKIKPPSMEHLQQEAQNMYRSMFEMKCLPPGRGLHACGSAITRRKQLYAAMNNCAFVSTDNLAELVKQKCPARPFVFLMDMSMLGVGVGFDVKGASSIVLHEPKRKDVVNMQIADTREGWVLALEALLNSYFLPDQRAVQFEYDQIREKGSPLKMFGGISSGPAALKRLLEGVRSDLQRDVGKVISVTLIVDIMNLIGVCVVSGNVGRSAEIAFGDADSDEFLHLKDYAKNPQRGAHGWASNNSVFATLGMDYTKIAARIQDNGEPGLAWLDNMRGYSRMRKEEKDDKDHKAKGGNPCLEQTLESYELCTLVEVFLPHNRSKKEFLDTLYHAFHYAKTVTLGETHWPETREVMRRNRRIGCSVSGVVQFLAQHNNDMTVLEEWLEAGYKAIHAYDKQFSDLFQVPLSIKCTAVKPSGTVSLLAGVTPGVHYPIAKTYIRRVRMNRQDPLLAQLIQDGYHLEPDVNDPSYTVIVQVPVCMGDEGKQMKTESEATIHEKFALAVCLQRHWADNQVSATISFQPEEGKLLPQLLTNMQHQLKGVSFLPLTPKQNVYPQMPYESVTPEQYAQLIRDIHTRKLDRALIHDVSRGLLFTKEKSMAVCAKDKKTKVVGTPKAKPSADQEDDDADLEPRVQTTKEKEDADLERNPPADLFCDGSSCWIPT